MNKDSSWPVIGRGRRGESHGDDRDQDGQPAEGDGHGRAPYALMRSCLGRAEANVAPRAKQASP